MNKELKLNARKEGYEYFDWPFDDKMKSNKYKYEMYLNTGFWWFRKYIREDIHIYFVRERLAITIQK